MVGTAGIVSAVTFPLRRYFRLSCIQVSELNLTEIRVKGRERIKRTEYISHQNLRDSRLFHQGAVLTQHVLANPYITSNARSHKIPSESKEQKQNPLGIRSEEGINSPTQ